MVAISCPSCGHAWNSTASKSSTFCCKNCNTTFRLSSVTIRKGKTSDNRHTPFGLTNWGGFKHEDEGLLTGWGGVK